MNLKVGVVGCGGVAKRWHFPELVKIEGVEFTSCCDVFEEKTKEVSIKYKVKPYTNLDEMLSKEKLDVVMVLTREQDRADAVIKCLKAGTNVFCEKAMSDSLKKAEEMVKTSKEVGRVLGINFNYRFSPPYLKLKEMILEGKFGEPCFISFITHGDCFHHILDLARNFMGEVKSVYAKYLIDKERKSYILGNRWLYTAGRYKLVAFEFENGFAGDIIGTDFMNYSHPLLSCTYVGTKGRATIPDIVGKLIYMPNDADAITWRPNFIQPRDFHVTFENSIRAFMDAMAKNQPPPVTGLDGLRALQIEEAIFLSQEKSIPIKPY